MPVPIVLAAETRPQRARFRGQNAGLGVSALHCQTPWGYWSVMEATSLRFAAAVRVLADECRRRGLVVPGFRSPPRLRGVDRSLRRRADGGATIAVALRGRPWAAVLSDMVEGVVVTNQLEGQAADRARSALWSALGGEEVQAA